MVSVNIKKPYSKMTICQKIAFKLVEWRYSRGLFGLLATFHKLFIYTCTIAMLYYFLLNFFYHHKKGLELRAKGESVVEASLNYVQNMYDKSSDMSYLPSLSKHSVRSKSVWDKGTDKLRTIVNYLRDNTFLDIYKQSPKYKAHWSGKRTKSHMVGLNPNPKDIQSIRRTQKKTAKSEAFIGKKYKKPSTKPPLVLRKLSKSSKSPAKHTKTTDKIIKKADHKRTEPNSQNTEIKDVVIGVKHVDVTEHSVPLLQEEHEKQLVPLLQEEHSVPILYEKQPVPLLQEEHTVSLLYEKQPIPLLHEEHSVPLSNEESQIKPKTSNITFDENLTFNPTAWEAIGGPDVITSSDDPVVMAFVLCHGTGILYEKKYLEETYLMLKSIVMTTDRRLDVYCIVDTLTTFKDILELIKPWYLYHHNQMRLIPVIALIPGREKDNQIVYENTHYLCADVKLFIPDVLFDVSKVLLLDLDFVWFHPIEYLWEELVIKNKDKMMGHSPNAFLTKQIDASKKTLMTGFYASLYLLNLEKMRNITGGWYKNLLDAREDLIVNETEFKKSHVYTDLFQAHTGSAGYELDVCETSKRCFYRSLSVEFYRIFLLETGYLPRSG